MSGRFESLRASRLFCRRCGRSMPVRERLLLVLPDKEIHEYLCTGCADPVGRREVTAAAGRRSPVPTRRRIRP